MSEDEQPVAAEETAAEQLPTRRDILAFPGGARHEPLGLLLAGLFIFLFVVGVMWFSRRDDAKSQIRNVEGAAYSARMATYQVDDIYRQLLKGAKNSLYTRLANETAANWARIATNAQDPVDKGRYFLNAAACAITSGDSTGARGYLARAREVHPQGEKLYQEFAPLFATPAAGGVTFSPKAEELLNKIASGAILRARNLEISGHHTQAMAVLASGAHTYNRLSRLSLTLFGILGIGFIAALIWLFATYMKNKEQREEEGDLPPPVPDTPPWGPGMALLVLSLHLLVWNFLASNINPFINPATDVMMSQVVNVISTLGSAALVLGFFLLVLGHRPWQWGVFGWHFNWRAVGMGIATMALVMPLVFAATLITDKLLNGQVSTHPLLTGLRSSSDIRYQLFLTAVAAVMAPLVEETFFRGILFRAWDARFGLWPAAVITGIFFASVHVSLSAMLPITVLGIGMALVTHYSRGIWASAITHALFNAYTTFATIAVMWSMSGTG
ncbi:MAG: CPBP family glutamic-type intramembrane protease [bacterium]